MSTFVGRWTTAYQVERRPWLLGLHGTQPGDNPSITLDVSAYTAGTHYPNGFIPSGTAVSKLANGLWGPFNAAEAAGEHGLLFGSTTIPDLTDLTKDVGAALVSNGAAIDWNRLPAGGRPTLAVARTNMPRLDFASVTP